MGPPTLRYQGIGWGHPLSGTKDWMGPPTLRGLDGATHSPVPRKCGWPLSSPTFSLFRGLPNEKTGNLRVFSFGLLPDNIVSR